MAGKSAALWITRSIKIAAIAVGGPLALLAGMAVVGAFVENGWARLAISLVAIIAVPAIVADRLLPDDPQRGRGIVTDVLAIAWLGFAFAVFGIGIEKTQPLIDQEARRLASADQSQLAKLTAWLGGGEPLLLAAAEGDGAPATPKVAKTTDALDAGPPTTAPADAGAASSEDTDVTAPADKPMNPEELFNQWSPAVVTIRVSAGPFMQGGGTGFVIDSAGTVITNYHVVGESTGVGVKLKDGRWADTVELLFVDKDRDVAVLRIGPTDELLPTLLGDSEEVRVGEKVISIGNPLGLEHTLTDGLVSARRKVRGKKMIQSTAPISPGNSGGPLFNLRGEVIGVTTATLSGPRGAQNLNLAIPINDVKALLKEDYPDAKSIGGGGPDMGTW